MALQAIIARCGQMLPDLNIGDLPPLPGSGNGIMTVAAANPAMITMSENSPKTVLRHSCAPVGSQFMARRAAADLGIRCVAGVAIIMRVDTRRNGLARTRWRVAKGTPLRRTPFPPFMGRMIEFHVKALFESCRKGFHRWVGRSQAGVTDRAHRPILFFSSLRNELVQVASDTRLVARKFQLALFALALMARDALKFFVLRYLVRELIEVRSGNFGCHRRQGI